MSEEKKVSRRTVAKGAAWAVPVVAVAAAAPAHAASGDYVLTFSTPLSSVNACDAITAGTLLLTKDGAGVTGASVAVTLPPGLQWSDGSTGSRTLTTTSGGLIDLSGLIVGSGSAGTYTVTAQGSNPSTNTASASLVLTANKGVIYFTSDEKTAADSDPTGVVADAVDAVVTGNYVYARTSTGKWFVKAGADVVSPYQQITGVPAIDSVWGGKGSDYGYAIAGGQVYGSAAGPIGYAVIGASGVTAMATTGGRTFALDSSGKVYRIIDGEDSFHQVRLATNISILLTDVTVIDGNQGGGYGWAISGTDIYYMLDNNLAYLSTSTANKPAAPKALAIGAGYAYALDGDGSVWAHAGASAGDWTQMTGLPAEATFIMANAGGDYIWALSNDTPYWGYAATGFSGSNPGALAGNIDQLWIGSAYAYVRTYDGQWWQRLGASSGGDWGRITGTPGGTVKKIATNWGNFGWAIADRNDVCAP